MIFNEPIIYACIFFIVLYNETARGVDMVRDAHILLSLINTKLRDFYDSLDKLCDEEEYDKEEVIDILKKIGYHYSSSLNQFVNE